MGSLWAGPIWASMGPRRGSSTAWWLVTESSRAPVLIWCSGSCWLRSEVPSGVGVGWSAARSHALLVARLLRELQAGLDGGDGMSSESFAPILSRCR